MNIYDTLSIIISLFGILVAIIGILYTFKIRDKGKAIKIAKNKQNAIDFFLSTKPSFINIMGVTLRGMFDKNYTGNILEYIQKNCQIPVKVLIINPYSISFFKFCQLEDKNTRIEDYQNCDEFQDILNLIEILKNLITERGNIEVRLYDSLPLGFILLSENYCLFEQYHTPASRQISVFKTPSALIQKAQNVNIYNIFNEHFVYSWERSKSIDIDPKDAAFEEISKIQRIINQVKNNSK